MAEFGAGFGKWGLESIHLGRRMGVYVRAILVETDPTHVAYIRDAIQAAGVPLAVQVLDAAIGGRDGVVEMVVGNAEAWCGQNLVSVRQLLSPESVVVESAADSKAHQHTQQHTHTPRDPGSVYLRTVTVVSLQTLLAGEEVVDLLHFIVVDLLHFIRRLASLCASVPASSMTVTAYRCA